MSKTAEGLMPEMYENFSKTNTVPIKQEENCTNLKENGTHIKMKVLSKYTKDYHPNKIKEKPEY